VICGLLAIPSIDHHAVGEWTAALSLATATPTPEARIGADRAIVAFDEYVTRLIAERRARPGDDLLSELIAVEEGGVRCRRTSWSRWSCRCSTRDTRPRAT
jgi:cytochrome P450